MYEKDKTINLALSVSGLPRNLCQLSVKDKVRFFRYELLIMTFIDNNIGSLFNIDLM